MARKRSLDEAGNEEKRKRRKLDFTEQLQELLETLRTYKTESGKVLCETFIRAPNRRSLAEYYDVVSQPIDLIKIQQKVRTDEYSDLESFSHDIELLINNSKSYYKEDSIEYQDACQLWQVFLKLREELFTAGDDEDDEEDDDQFAPIDEDETSNETIGEETALQDVSGVADNDNVSSSTGSEQNSEEDVFEELFSAVMSATSDDGRQIASMFQMLPPKATLPDYYEVVTEPIDLKTIAKRIQAQEYTNLSDLEKDFMLMVRNAKTYNAPGSQIYKDANALRKLIISKKAEIELRKAQPLKSSQRIRAKRQTTNNPKWSSIVAALKYKDQKAELANDFAAALDYEDEDEDELGTDDVANLSDLDQDAGAASGRNSLWLLYNAVKDAPNSEPFMRLPSKRFYPDYYKEIKKPTSLSKIGQKLKQGLYANIQQLNTELTLVFDNAMNYNRPDSKIYKDAVKLKKILTMKAKEIMLVYKDDEDDEEEDMDDENDDEDDEDGVGENEETEDETTFNVRSNTTSTAKASGKRKTRKSSKSMMNAMSKELTNVRRSQKVLDGELKKRMRLLCSAIMEYEEDGRYLIGPFIEKPSKKLYPDYYDIIDHPIDMNTIENNVKNEVYHTEEALVAHFMLMFSNCRKYNEDNSQIYQDAVTLEQVLRNKQVELGPLNIASKPKKERVRPSSGTSMKIKTLFETVRDYQDSKGRFLSPIFMKLPSRVEFPDYYEVIRKPMCLEKIGQRVKNCIYETVEDILSDIILMLDNACKYNEPDSQIFKDALTLQQVALQTKIELNEDSVNGIPDVKIIVQDLLTNLFISVYNHQDEEGRCFSDSINELTELANKNGEFELKTLNFDIVKRNLNAGRYRRMDRFQTDMFEVFERARKMSRTDSQAFEDSIELQQYFITLRNDICKGGQVLATTALHYDRPQLLAHIEALRREKVPKELNEEDAVVVKAEEKDPFGASSGVTFDNDEEMIVYQDQVYKTGDYVLVQPRDNNLEPHIIYIEKFKKDAAGQVLIYGCWFYRPHETFHMQSRKFLESEVFKTDNFTTTPLSQVLRKCCVMFVKDYFRSRPLEVADDDVFVCESRYQSKSKTFKKIKIWPCMQNLPYVLRDIPLAMNRVPSVFKSGHVPASGSVEKMEDQSVATIALEPDAPIETSILDVLRPNIQCPRPADAIPVEGAQYFEQFTIPAGTFRVGDCAYVRTDQERNLICRIDYMWTDQEQNPYFHGPWFVQQAELPPNTIGSFYPQEVFLSSIEDTNPLLSICERCSVLETLDYAQKRPTEIDEKDVYVCEYRYLEHEKKFLTMPEGMRQFKYQMPATVQDEIYYFKKPLILSKPTYQLPQVLEDVSGQTIYADATDGGLLPQTVDIDGNLVDVNGTPITAQAQAMMMTPQGMIGVPIPMAASARTPASIIPSTPQLMATPGLTPNLVVASNNATPVMMSTATTAGVSTVKKKTAPKRLVTGYIIFASEIRRSVVEANPDRSFGEISRIIGQQWKVLSQASKNEYEARAKEQNAEVKEAAAAEKARLLAMSPDEAAAHAAGTLVNDINQVYSCHWENKCDFQFEDCQDLFDHMTKEPDGHVWISYAETKDKDPGEFQCLYHGCGRVKKGAAPFPTIVRLIRHCKEVHWTKHVPKTIDPDKRSKNYVCSTRAKAPTSGPPTPAPTPVQLIGQPQQQQIQQMQTGVGQQTIQLAQQAQPAQQQHAQTQFLAVHQPQQIQIQQAGGHVVQVATSQAGGAQQIIGGNAGGHQVQLQLQPNGQFQVVQATGAGGQAGPATTYQIHQNQQGQITFHPSHLQQAMAGVPHHQGIHLATTAQGQQIQIQTQPQVQQQQQQQPQQQQQQQAQVQQIQQQQQVLQMQPQQPIPQTTTLGQAAPLVPGSMEQQSPSSSSCYPNLSQIINSAPVCGLGVQVKPAEPIFVGAPPRSNKLMHTTTYMKYIQKLKPDVRYLSDWEKELTATPQNTRVEPSRVQVSNWMNNAPVKQDMVVDALWNLRYFMIKNTLNLTNLS